MTQPEALRLADVLEISSNHGMRREAAAELRRLHAENERLRAALAEPVQEPVAWRFQSAVGGWAYGSQPPVGSKYPVFPLYAAPPQRKPLTEEEIDSIWDSEKAFADIYAIVRAIERAHGVGGQP